MLSHFELCHSKRDLIACVHHGNLDQPMYPGTLIKENGPSFKGDDSGIFMLACLFYCGQLLQENLLLKEQIVLRSKSFSKECIAFWKDFVAKRHKSDSFGKRWKEYCYIRAS